MSKNTGKPDPNDKQARMKAALRANLQKRKAQGRMRKASGKADKGAGNG